MISQSPESDETSTWTVLDYEVQMYLGTSHVRKNLSCGNSPKTQIIKNALVESSLIHMRILTDIFLSRGNRPDDVQLKNFGFEDIVQHAGLAEMIDSFKNVYGKSSDEDSNCWIINKKFAHPTTQRSDRYDYSAVFNALDPLLKSIIYYVYNSKGRQLPYPLQSES
ncbi:MAG: hypothetical protein WD740_07810 [Anaerolineales bacterium]